MKREIVMVIDRIEEERFAVLLAEVSNEEFVIDAGRLPAGAQEGSYVTATIIDGTIDSLALDEEKTAAMEKEITEKLQRIRSKSSRSRFKRN